MEPWQLRDCHTFFRSIVTVSCVGLGGKKGSPTFTLKVRLQEFRSFLHRLKTSFVKWIKLLKTCTELRCSNQGGLFISQIFPSFVIPSGGLYAQCSVIPCGRNGRENTDRKMYCDTSEGSLIAIWYIFHFESARNATPCVAPVARCGSLWLKKNSVSNALSILSCQNVGDRNLSRCVSSIASRFHRLVSLV